MNFVKDACLLMYVLAHYLYNVSINLPKLTNKHADADINTYTYTQTHTHTHKAVPNLLTKLGHGSGIFHRIKSIPTAPIMLMMFYRPMASKILQSISSLLNGLGLPWIYKINTLPKINYNLWIC